MKPLSSFTYRLPSNMVIKLYAPDSATHKVPDLDTNSEFWRTTLESMLATTENIAAFPDSLESSNVEHLAAQQQVIAEIEQQFKDLLINYDSLADQVVTDTQTTQALDLLRQGYKTPLPRVTLLALALKDFNDYIVDFITSSPLSPEIQEELNLKKLVINFNDIQKITKSLKATYAKAMAKDATYEEQLYYLEERSTYWVCVREFWRKVNILLNRVRDSFHFHHTLQQVAAETEAYRTKYSQEKRTTANIAETEQLRQHTLKVLEDAVTHSSQKELQEKIRSFYLGRIDGQEDEEFADYLELLEEFHDELNYECLRPHRESISLFFDDDHPFMKLCLTTKFRGISFEHLANWWIEISEVMQLVTSEQYYVARKWIVLHLNDKENDVFIPDSKLQQPAQTSLLQLVQELPLHLAVSGGKDSLALYWIYFMAVYYPGILNLAPHNHGYVHALGCRLAFAHLPQEIGVSHVNHQLQDLNRVWQEFMHQYTLLSQDYLTTTRNYLQALEEVHAFIQYANASLIGFSNACSIGKGNNAEPPRPDYLAPQWLWLESLPEHIEKAQQSSANIKNTEARAREYRYSLMAQRLQDAINAKPLVASVQKGILAIGHQLNDYYETTAMQLERVAGWNDFEVNPDDFDLMPQLYSEYRDKLDSFEISPITNQNLFDKIFIQPKGLELTISMQRPFCDKPDFFLTRILADIGSPYVVDPMNDDPKYRRVAWRKYFAEYPEQLEILEKIYDIGIEYLVDHLKAIRQLDSEYNGKIVKFTPSCIRFSGIAYNNTIKNIAPIDIYNSLLDQKHNLPDLSQNSRSYWNYQSLIPQIEKNFRTDEIHYHFNNWLWEQTGQNLNYIQFKRVIDMCKASPEKAGFFVWRFSSLTSHIDAALLCRHEGYLICITEPTVVNAFLYNDITRTTNRYATISSISDTKLPITWSLVPKEGTKEYYLTWNSPRSWVWDSSSDTASESTWGRINISRPFSGISRTKLTKQLRSRHIPWPIVQLMVDSALEFIAQQSF